MARMAAQYPMFRAMEIIQEFGFMWQEYAMADHETLDGEAQEVRMKMLWLMRDLMANLPMELRPA